MAPAPGAETDAAELAAAVREAGLPVIVAPGNHDMEASRLLRVFGDQGGAHRLKGYLLYSFADPYAADNTCMRPRESIERFLNEPTSAPIDRDPAQPDLSIRGLVRISVHAGERS